MKRFISILLILGMAAGFSVTGYAGQPSQYVVNLGDARWNVKLNAGLDALWDIATYFATLVNNWAIEDNIVTMVPVTCTYSDNNTFTLPGNYTSRFPTGAVVQVQVATGMVSSTVASSSYAAPTTTVNLNDTVLTNPITRVYVVATRDGLWPNGPGYVVARDYGTDRAALVAADAVAAAAGKELRITAVFPIDADVTLAAPKVKVQPGVPFAISTTKTLTILKDYEAGLYQTFSCTGTGKVEFKMGAIKEVFPEWWGAKADGVDDCTAAFIAAINSANDPVDYVTAKPTSVRLSAGKYKITTGNIAIPMNTTIIGAGKTNTQIDCGGQDINLFTFTGTVQFVRFEGFSVTGLGTTSGVAFYNNATIANVTWSFVDGSTGYSFFQTKSGKGIVSCRMVDCQFSAYTGPMIDVETNVFYNVMHFDHCRFELTSGPHFKAVGNETTVVKFNACVFESTTYESSIITGNNATYKFTSCWFENNGGTNVTAYEIDARDANYVTSIDINGSWMNGGKVGLTNLITLNIAADAKWSISNCHINGTSALSNYKLVYYPGPGRYGKLENNIYTSPITNFVSGTGKILYVNDQPNRNGCYGISGDFATATTTNATPTAIWSIDNLNTNGTLYIVADVTCFASGNDLGSFTISGTFATLSATSPYVFLVTDAEGAPASNPNPRVTQAVKGGSGSAYPRTAPLATLAVDGAGTNNGTINLMATGEAGKTYYWSVYIRSIVKSTPY